MPPSTFTHQYQFFWSGRSKRKGEVSNWIKIFAKVLSKAIELFPKLFLETNGQPKPAHLHMLRDTFAVEYLLAGVPLEEVSQLLGHASVLVTQKHYAPWVLQRQQRLAESPQSSTGRVSRDPCHLHRSNLTAQCEAANIAPIVVLKLRAAVCTVRSASI